MSLRCPLCLEKLKPGTRFLRFCLQHLAPPVVIEPYDHWESTMCPHDSDSHRPMEGSVFLLHMECVCKNPFWNVEQNKIVIPEKVRIESSLPNGEKVRQPIDHWTIEVLRTLAGHKPDVSEMWFPQALFRAANLSTGKEDDGVLVLMLGASSTGKTVFSTMAMVSTSYPAEVHVEDFIHITPERPGMESEEFLRILQVLKNLMKGSGTADPLPRSAAPNICNIKCVQLSLAKEVTQRMARKFATGEFLLKSLKAIFGRPGGGTNSRQRVVAFYDMAGERFEQSWDLKVMSMGQQMHVLAIFVDATALSRSGAASSVTSSKDSVWVAREHLKKTKTFAGRRCIIVTKFDEVLTREAAAKGEEPDFKGRRNDRKKDRATLLEWIKNGDANEKTLYRELSQDPDLEVFFIYTTGLGDRHQPSEAHGLYEFVLWCLNWPAQNSAEATA